MCQTWLYALIMLILGSTDIQRAYYLLEHVFFLTSWPWYIYAALPLVHGS